MGTLFLMYIFWSLLCKLKISLKKHIIYSHKDVLRDLIKNLPTPRSSFSVVLRREEHKDVEPGDIGMVLNP